MCYDGYFVHPNISLNMNVLMMKVFVLGLDEKNIILISFGPTIVGEYCDNLQKHC
jgi:hypothetical protein